MYAKIRGGISAPKGFRSAGTHCGIKKKAKDLALICSDVPCTAAGLFTTNQVTAAPVVLTKKHIANGKAQAVIVNSGNANCCTGTRGEQDARAMAELTARELGISPDMVLVCSTGGIGKHLPMREIARGIPRVTAGLSRGYEDAAEAILTTDLVSKHVAVELKIGRAKVRIGGIAKGSGMIEPNMATMLAFITTDAAVDRSCIRTALKEGVNDSFNRITVDGDMSTNDTVLLLANGRAENETITAKKHGREFKEALTHVCRSLARKIVVDGEGATKFITVRVENASSMDAARTVARAIANSPLVKTAMYGENPNWGRIMSSIGSSGVRIKPEKAGVSINGLLVVTRGARAEYTLGSARARMRRKEILITVDLALGRAADEIWTCDFSHKYVDINV